jgi:2'-5' RNA ligase
LDGRPRPHRHEEKTYLSSKTLYDGIYAKNIERLELGDILIDEGLAGDGRDFRLGISLIIPIRSLSNAYGDLVASLNRIDPAQYCYPYDDLHITVFDLIKVGNTYKRNEELENSFLTIAREAVKSIRPFKIRLEGIVFSREAGLIQGYDDNALIEIRKQIRKLLINNGIKNEERYESESAHITFVRFENRLSRPKEYGEFIGRNRRTKMGMESVAELELVEHDWYNRKATKRIIGKIEL